MRDITIIAYANQSSLGIPMNYYSWQGQPMWQYVYQRFSNLDCSNIIIIGLDTLESDPIEKSIKEILSKERTTDVLLFDMSLAMLNDKTLEWFLNNNKAVVATSFLKNACYDYLNDKTLSSNEMCIIESLQKYNRRKLLDVFENNNISNLNEIFSLYKKNNEILFKELTNDEKIKLINKKDARIINFLKS